MTPPQSSGVQWYSNASSLTKGQPRNMALILGSHFCLYYLLHLITNLEDGEGNSGSQTLIKELVNMILSGVELCFYFIYFNIYSTNSNSTLNLDPYQTFQLEDTRIGKHCQLEKLFGVQQIIIYCNRNRQGQLIIIEDHFEMKNRTYEIQVDKNNKRVINLLPDDFERATKKLNITGANLQVERTHSSVRIYPGPLPNIKIVSVFRLLFDQTNQSYYSYASINSLDMDADILRMENIAQLIEPIGSKIRYTPVHPSGREMMILTDVKIERYFITESKEDDRTYDLVLQKRKEFNSSWYDDLQYHPSGKYLIGIFQQRFGEDDDKKLLKPFKLDPETLQFQIGQNIRSKCIAMQYYYQFPVKWVISVDRNDPSRAIFGNSMDTVCIWHLDSPNITIQFKKVIETPSTTLKSKISTESSSDSPFTSSGIGFLNSSSPDAYTVGFKSNRAKAVFLTKPSYVRNDGFTYYPDEQQAISKCVDIPDINAFACLMFNLKHLRIFKIDFENQTNNLLYMESSEIRIGPFQFEFEEVFYNPRQSEICYAFDSVLECLRIQTRCVPKKELANINECPLSCEKYIPDSFWNPVSMSCESCSNSTCKCSHSIQQFNPYYRSCVLDCQKIPYGGAESIYANATKCACQHPYEWFIDAKQCRINCSTIANSVDPQNFKGLGIKECRCLPGYIFRTKLGSLDIPGHCELECKHGRLQIENNKSKCVCEGEFKWNSNFNQCVELQKVNKGLPGWGIAMIVIGSLLFFALAAFLIRRCIMRRKEQRKRSQEANANAEADKNSGSPGTDRYLATGKINKTDHSSKDSIHQTCVVCKSQENPVNCKAPCGHFFHFFCVKPLIDQGQVECPQCFKVFHNGVADLQFVETQEQIITISDN